MRFIILIFISLLFFSGCAKRPTVATIHTPGKGFERITSVDTVVTKEMIQSVKKRMPTKK